MTTAPLPTPLRRNRDYTLLWVGQAGAEVGFSATMIAFPLLVLALTGSAAASGLVLAVDAAAQLVVGLPAGALVDRWSRKRVMLACEAAQATALASLVAAVVLEAATVPHLVAVAAVIGVCRALFEPAEDASLPTLVAESQVADAVALNNARSSVGQMAGTALGGVLFAVGRFVPFLLDLLTHVLAFIALLFVRLPHRRVERAPLRGLGGEIAEGLRWVWGRSEMRVTALCAIGLNLLFTAYYLAVIVLAEQRGTPAGEIGVMGAMLGIGGVLGALVAPVLYRRLSPYLAIIGVFWALACLAPLALPVGSGYAMGAVFAGMALLAPTANTTIVTHQLLRTPDALRGRLSGVMNVVVGGAGALGPALGGVLAEVAGPDRAVLACAAGLALVAALATTNPTLRHYPRTTEEDTE